MNIRDLKYFLSVLQHGHFGNAAKASYVSQPALSMQLKKLEEELGVKLFERSPKNIIATDPGKKIAKIAENILFEVDEIKKIAKAAQSPFAGVFKLGAFPTLAPYLFPKVIPKIKKKHPQLSLRLIEEKTDDLLEQLHAGELDAVLLALPIAADSQYDTISLFHDEFYLAVAKEHPLAKLKSISQARLAEQELLLLTEGHCLREQALELCELAHAKEAPTFRATSLETLRQMVAINEGITLMPNIAINKKDPIVYIPFTKPTPSREIGIVYRKESARIECINSIAEIIINQPSP